MSSPAHTPFLFLRSEIVMGWAGQARFSSRLPAHSVPRTSSAQLGHSSPGAVSRPWPMSWSASSVG